MTTLRVVVADDHPLMLSAVTAKLRAEADMEVVATATNCADLMLVVRHNQPDVAVIDLTMRDGSTIDALPELAAASPTTRFLLLSATENDADVARAIERGAAGFLSKEVDADDVARHVRDAAAGHTVLDTRAAAAVVAQLRAPRADELSPRELEVLILVAAGRSNREIGEQLYVSLSTVKTHLERAFTKLGVSDRAEAVARAKDLRLF